MPPPAPPRSPALAAESHDHTQASGAYPPRRQDGRWRPAPDLERRNVRHGDFRNADLSRARLYRTDFRFADLTGADLSHADLRSAQLASACLDDANLAGALLQGADFSNAKGLTAGALGGAEWSTTTKWPVDFVPPPRRGPVPRRAEIGRGGG